MKAGGVLGITLAFGGGAHGPQSKLGNEVCAVRAVRALLNSGVVDEVAVLAQPPSSAGALEELFRDAAGVVVLSRPPDVGPDTLLLVHDATRPLAPSTLVGEVVAAARQAGMPVVPVLPVTDTMRQLDASGFLLDAVDRDGLRIVQSPVAVPARLLPAAQLEGITRCVELVGRLPGQVVTIPGDPRAIEIRTAWDRKLAEAMMVS